MNRTPLNRITLDDRRQFEADGAIFGLHDLARAKAMQNRAHDLAHVGVVVDDEETQAVEIDADHAAPWPRAACARYPP